MVQVILRNASTGQMYRLDRPLVRIGRTPDNDIVINDNSISRSHAQIIQGSGVWFILDCQSTNGVILNNRRIMAGENVQLSSGDRIQLAPSVCLLFLVEGQTATVSAPQQYHQTAPALNSGYMGTPAAVPPAFGENGPLPGYTNQAQQTTKKPKKTLIIVFVVILTILVINGIGRYNLKCRLVGDWKDSSGLPDVVFFEDGEMAPYSWTGWTPLGWRIVQIKHRNGSNPIYNVAFFDKGEYYERVVITPIGGNGVWWDLYRLK